MIARPAGPADPADSADPAVPPRLRAPRLLLAALAVVSLLLFASLLVPGRLAGEVFALLGVAFPVGLIALGVVGASRRGRLDRRLDRRLGFALGLLLVLLEGSAVGILALSGSGAAGPSGPWRGLGLPAASLVQLVGLWLLPLPLVALAYAWTFDRAGVTREDLAALRRRARRPVTADGLDGPERP